MFRQNQATQALDTSRRRFFGTAIAGMFFGAMTPRGANSDVHDLVTPLTKAARDALNPDEIVARAKAGNERFRTGRKKHRDLLVELQKTAGGQSPAAVILGCIDSRAPAEIIFDLGLSDIFNCRVAGS